ncbi:flavodoxin domain-containing protein [Streptomyces sp. NPDC097981]|uniref:flavodoxin domain-containing protein n=1 Tax=Streptomyces sp. NPDC097981 TaxID=3155428 RepID=UPI0033348DF6
MNILVCQATEHGSTGRIAALIAVRLRAADHSVVMRTLTTRDAEQLDLTCYKAVVVGSAIHHGAWLPAAAEFVRRSSDALAARRVWTFSVGMTAAFPSPLRRLAANGEQRPLAELQQLAHSCEHRRFSGAIRPEHIGRPGRVAFRLLGGRYGDYVDEQAVEAWTDSIDDALREDPTATLVGRSAYAGYGPVGLASPALPALRSSSPA